MKTIVSGIIYFLIGFLFIFLPEQPAFLPAFVLKALILPVLMILFLTNIKPSGSRLHNLMFAGLFFSWAGDVFLEVPQSAGDLFIPGLLCFLLAHVMYLTVFLTTPGKNIILRKSLRFLIPLIIYGSGLVFYLYNYLVGMRLPVILYAIVILTMLAGAFNRFEKVNRASYYLVLAGAILFVISDSALAVNKFNHHFKVPGFIVMVTYIFAQFLIVTGYIKQFRNNFE